MIFQYTTYLDATFNLTHGAVMRKLSKLQDIFIDIINPINTGYYIALDIKTKRNRVSLLENDVRAVIKEVANIRHHKLNEKEESKIVSAVIFFLRSDFNREKREAFQFLK